MNKNKVLSSFFWKFAERCGAEIVQFIVSIVIARILAPSDYGIIGIITVFIAVANVFITSGFSQALVQRKDVTDVDYSTVFFFGIGFSAVVYAVMYVAAPFIADFYNADITSLIRVLSLTIIVSSLNSVQHAYVQKTMQFKRFFVSTLTGRLVSATVGIAMAYTGFGVWALVAQQISLVVVDAVVLWFTVRWRPKLAFSVQRMKILFSYGWKLLCSSLIDTIYSNIYSLVIGRFYTTSELGYYNRGKQFPMMVISNVNTAIDSVLFPAMSEIQNENARLKSMVRRSIVTSTFIIFPAMAGLAAIAKPLTVFLLTDKWLPAVPFIQFCCFTYAFWPVHTANLQAIKALGRSDVFLKLEIIKKVIGIVILAITLPYGLTMMMIGRCVSTIISSFINAYPNKKLLGYSYVEQLKDMAPSLLFALIMAVSILPITLLPINSIWQMVIQIPVAMVVYFGLAKLFKLERFEYILKTIKGFLKRR